MKDSLCFKSQKSVKVRRRRRGLLVKKRPGKSQAVSDHRVCSRVRQDAGLIRLFNAACAAANRAMGTRNGEQET